jgi:ATP-dependent DNA helicase RecG
MYNVALNNGQSALLAPTEILAKQHFDTILKMFEGYKTKIVLYTRSQRETNFLKDTPELSKKETSKIILDGIADIVVGTHAILSDKIEFKNLSLAIVDEQHRFGVEQRKSIRQKGESAHFLSMTATPIPRSLALLAYGDLELSQITEMPLGRKPIKTRIVESFNRQNAYDFIRQQIKIGRQVFVVCPLIEDDADEKKSVMKEYEKLSKEVYPDLKIGFLHGRLKPDEKESTMERFKNKEIDILVSTSVVEVGIDIPNASVMVIEQAERFGLAQLHQFRGRVGRSEHQSYCLLFTDSTSQKSMERLGFFEKNLNGFKLAEKDLQTRGPGEVYGTEQSGEGRLRLAKITDIEIMRQAREMARELCPDLVNYPLLKVKLEDFEKKVHLE